eukprot:NODE_1742_length_857_cov_509.007426_g1373_i0.p1 GENE.NODE_1742_length_857_cov_509.007426_g1373_i0~~NODE_1742_length_857_cov_509.007426_g1373_i0.p1  ORF type:complete len:272 (-),score=74.71 NODE_1742_length_857_cov_509.007426_g1373_i0:41-802(-)
MAVGKNKRLSKGGKRGAAKRKVTDFMTRKEWYDIVAPACFTKRHAGKTLINRSAGTKLAPDLLKGRVFEISLGDLQSDEQVAHRNIKLRAEDVKGRSIITNFHGMALTTDKLRSLVRKWCTLVEAAQDVKTSDGYLLRVFIIGFTKRRPNQVNKNCYAKTAKVLRLRRKMREIVKEKVAKADLQNCVKKFQQEELGQDIEKASNGIYPLRDVMVRKVKVLRRPKEDSNKLMEAHGGEIPPSREDVGVSVEAEE